MVGAAEPELRENEKNKRLQRTRQHMSTFANFFLTKIAQKKLSQAKEFLLTLWGKLKNHAVTHKDGHTLFKVYTELILCTEVGIPVFCQVDSLQYAFMKIPPLCRVLTQLRMQRKILIKHEILALANFIV